MFFGEKVKALRKEKGLSQRQLGEKMGVKQQTVAQYEKAIEQPKLSTVRKIAEALGIPLSELTERSICVTDGEVFEGDSKSSSHFVYIEQVKKNHDRLLESFMELSLEGQQKVIKYSEDLEKISEYRKKK